ncbi:MAG TPA: PaaI family thioesterase [Acidimicrobiia bacterium]
MDTEHFSTVAAALTESGRDMLPGAMGFEIVELGPGRAALRADIRQDHLAPNGYLHAGAVVALADTTAGFGCVANLPEGATGFTTIELKTNFLSTLLEGSMTTEGRMVHGGRTTQLWDVEVKDEVTAKTLALFRCTQLLLYPRG